MPNIFFIVIQRQCAAASDAACSNYYQTVPEHERTGHGVWSAMEKAITKTVKFWRGQRFDKMVAIANPANGLIWEQEVRIYLDTVQLLKSLFNLTFF